MTPTLSWVWVPRFLVLKFNSWQTYVVLNSTHCNQGRSWFIYFSHLEWFPVKLVRVRLCLISYPPRWRIDIQKVVLRRHQNRQKVEFFWIFTICSCRTKVHKDSSTSKSWRLFLWNECDKIWVCQQKLSTTIMYLSKSTSKASSTSLVSSAKTNEIRLDSKSWNPPIKAERTAH